METVTHPKNWGTPVTPESFAIWKKKFEEEKKLKSKGITHVISALDNDECGVKGTNYLKTIFKKVTRFVYKNGIKDPGEMSKEIFDNLYKKTLERYAQDRRKQ